METVQKTELQKLLKQSISKSTSYLEYRTLVKTLTDKNLSTGETQTDELANYTLLNDRRMKRWDKTVKITEAIQEEIKSKNINQTWLVLTESWCGDAAHLMPVMQKIAALNAGINFKVILRDENDALMSRFLTNGGKSIPMLLMIDNETDEVINTFGPRPKEATKLVNDYKAAHGKLTAAFKTDLQSWYNKDKGQNAIKDLVSLMH